MVAEDELEHEVEQADVIKEKIGLRIMDNDEALQRTSSHVVTDPATTGDDSSRTTPSTKDSDSTHTHPGGVPSTPLSTEMGVDPPTLPPPTDPTGPVLTPPSTVPATGDTTLVTPSSLITLHVKLPKLSIKKFNRDLTKWVTFWDSFDSSIHSNLSLLNVDKFNYLNTFLHLYDAVEVHVRGLRALGVTADSYGGRLTSILISKLPLEIWLIISRELTNGMWGNS